MSTSSKLIIIIVLSALTLGAGYWLWTTFLAPTTAPAPTTSEQPGVIGPGLSLVSTHSIAGYWVNGIETYTIADTGEIYKTVGDKEEQVTTQPLSDIRSINGSPDGSVAIVSFGSPAQETYSLFDTKTKSWQPLPANAVTADWDPKSSNRIAYLTNTGSLQLYTLNNKKSSEVLKINLQDVQLEWPSTNFVYLTEKPSFQPSSAWQIDIAKKFITSFAKNENQLAFAWAPDGSWAVKTNAEAVSIINDKKQTLVRLTAIDPTLPEKCAIGSKNIFCAAPKQTVNPENYAKQKTYSDDSLFDASLLLGVTERINAVTTEKLLPIGTWDLTNLTVANGRLFFVNRLDNKLYSLAL